MPGLQKDLHAFSTKPQSGTGKGGSDRAGIGRTYPPNWHRPNASGQPQHGSQRTKKGAQRVESQPLALVAAPDEDVVEIDEICVRLTPSLWLWIAVSRRVGQVLGFALGRRDQETLALCWSDVPPDYVDKPIATDGYETYGRFFDSIGRARQHTAWAKGSGQTSKAESLSTKWRQRHSGLVRRCCGTSRRMENDLLERFFLRTAQHNQGCQKRWERQQRTTLKDQ